MPLALFALALSAFSPATKASCSPFHFSRRLLIASASSLDVARGLGEHLQRRRDVAFEIKVGVQLLIDHVAFELIFVDGDDLALGRPRARRIPGHAAADEQNEIGILQIFVVGDAEIERMVGREIAKVGAAAPGHRQRQQIGQLDQRLERRRIAAGLLGDDDRVFGGEQQVGDLLHFARMRLHARRGRHLALVLAGGVQSCSMCSSATLR